MKNNFNVFSSDMVHVDAYTKLNGTFVDEYWRRKPSGAGNPITSEYDENAPHTVFVPENTDDKKVMYFGGEIFSGVGNVLSKAGEIAKETAVKAGEIAKEAVQKAGEAAGKAPEIVDLAIDTSQNTGEVVSGASQTVLNGYAVINDYVEQTVEVAQSGILDMVKDALSKIDTDEIVEILSQSVKKFGDILEKYPELQKAYDNLRSMRVSATNYRVLNRQQRYKEAKTAKNNAIVAAKDFGQEIQKLSSSKLPVLRSASGQINNSVNIGGLQGTNVRTSYDISNGMSNFSQTYREPSMLDIMTPATDFWTNPYYTNLEPLQNRINVGEFKGKVYKTKSQIEKKMKGYAYIDPNVQKGLGQIGYNKYPVASEYYKIALNGVKVTGTSNIKCKLYELPNKKLIDFVQQKYKVSGGIDVVIPNNNADIRTEIISSQYFWETLKENMDKISNSPNSDNSISLTFESSGSPMNADLQATIHKAEIYSPYYDANGNIHLIIVDYYDFAPWKEFTKIAILNNTAYIQQELGELTNYVIIIPMIVTP